MPILELQQRLREIGRIRLGEKGAKGQPMKLSSFRVTSPGRHVIEKVAELYGGNPQSWTPQGGTQQWEVVTNSTRLPILIPPQPITQWMELWTGGGCVRRCDGARNVISDDACECPLDPGERNAAAAKGKACKPTTRLNVVLREVEGIGVFRLETHGWNAALELPQVAAFLAQATAADRYLEAHLGLEERTSRTPGQDVRRYLVPVIDVAVTPAQLMAGAGNPAAAIESGTAAVAAAPKALPSGGEADFFALTTDATTFEEVRALYHQAREAGALTDELASFITDRGNEMRRATPAPETEMSIDDLWTAIVGIASADMTTTELHRAVVDFTGGVTAAEASPAQLHAFLEHLRSVPA